jgi:hypothetical protein
MHAFLNSRPLAQLVALDLMADEARRAEVSRGRSRRRSARLGAASLTTPAPVETGRPRWRMARALHLVH